MEENTNLKNRRISPKGMIDLPFVVRKALGFRKGEKQLLKVKVESDKVQISPASEPGPDTCTVSPRGLMQLPQEAQEIFSQKGKRRYAVQMTGDAGSYDDASRQSGASEVFLFSA